MTYDNFCHLQAGIHGCSPEAVSDLIATFPKGETIPPEVFNARLREIARLYPRPEGPAETPVTFRHDITSFVRRGFQRRDLKPLVPYMAYNWITGSVVEMSSFGMRQVAP